jgi:hypothetical protein
MVGAKRDEEHSGILVLGISRTEFRRRPQASSDQRMALDTPPARAFPREKGANGWYICVVNAAIAHSINDHKSKLK